MKSMHDSKELDLVIFVIEELREQLRRDGAALPLRGKIVQIARIAGRAKLFDDRFDSPHDQVTRLGVDVTVEYGYDPHNPTTRLAQYFVSHVGSVLDHDELAVVSGVSEFLGFIHQLRTEKGYRIFTGAAPDPSVGIDLKPGQYVLATVDVDQDASRRWHVASRIRHRAVSPKSRLLKYLKENVGKVVTTEELAYVSRDKCGFGKKTQELRTEQGYAIATRYNGRPDLSVGEYVLLSPDRIAEPHDRHIHEAVQKEVYARDENTCQNRSCRYRWVISDPRILELHHIKAHARRGPNTADIPFAARV
jgi:hypothetical protein